MVVSKRCFEFLGERHSATPFYLIFTSFLPQFYLFLTSFLPLFNLNLTSASSRLSNHGLETTVYIPLGLPDNVLQVAFSLREAPHISDAWQRNGISQSLMNPSNSDLICLCYGFRNQWSKSKACFLVYGRMESMMGGSEDACSKFVRVGV